ncbi:MAG: hypothetical protein HUJ72_12100 [Blautia sp.]|nr:hypothetical protein [Blautia sp.]
MATGAVLINGGTYYFDKKTGYRVTGLLTLKGKKYYLDPKNNGRMVTGWYGKLPNRYYFTKKGVMCCDVVGKIGTKYYGFAPNGKMYYNNLIYKDHKAILFNSKGEASYFKQGTSLDSGILKNLKDMGTFRVTYYCPCYSCSEGWGNGVSNRCGSPIHNKKGCEYAVLNHTIAVDPSVLPFGSAVYVNGIIYVAEDRGGGVIGKHIDIFVKDHTKAGSLFTSAEVYLLK